MSRERAQTTCLLMSGHSFYGLMTPGAKSGWVTNWVTITAHVHGRGRTAAH